MEHKYVPLLLIVLLAFAVPFLLSRFRRIPVVVGEILAGIIVGPSILGWVQTGEPTLELLAEIGFAFLMFLSGLEIDFSLLFRSNSSRPSKGLSSIWLAVISFLITLGLSLLIGFGLTSWGYVRDPWMMALILSTTSLGIVVPVLKEKGLITGRFGQSLLVAALIADFLTMFLITIYVAVKSTGLSLNILLILTLFIAVLILYQVASRQLKRRNIRQLVNDLAGTTSQVKVRGAFAIMIAFVVLAELIGAELILGAFLGGALASLLSSHEDEGLRHKLDAIGYGFFIPLFFIHVGVGFNLSAFLNDPSAWVLFPIMLVAAFGIKLISMLVFKTAYSWRETLASGFLLSARLSLIIAASAIGLRLGVISEGTNAIIILVAATTAIVSPLLFNSIIPAKPHHADQVILIFGSGDLAMQAARELRGHNESVCFVEPDSEKAASLREKKLDVSHHISDLTACVEDKTALVIKSFMAISDDDSENLTACQVARNEGIDHIVAMVINPLLLPKFKDLGVQTITPSLHRASLLAMMARNAAIFNLMTSTEDDRDFYEVELQNRTLEGKSISSLGLPQELLILAVQRDDEVVIPHGNTRLAFGDRLTILGNYDALHDAENILRG